MKKIATKIVKFYKNNSLRIWLSGYSMFYTNCKYHPTCSEYTIQAIDKYGLARGLAKGASRILRCNPLSKGGINLP